MDWSISRAFGNISRKLTYSIVCPSGCGDVSSAQTGTVLNTTKIAVDAEINARFMVNEMSASNKPKGTMPSTSSGVGCEAALTSNYKQSAKNGNSSKEFVKPISFSLTLHLVFALFFIIAEHQESIETGTVYSSTKQVLLITESQTIQPMLANATAPLANTKAPKSTAIDPTIGSLNLGVIDDQEPANVPIVEPSITDALKDLTKTAPPAKTPDTQPLKGVLPTGISDLYEKNSENKKGFHRSSAPQKSINNTDDETTTEEPLVNRLAQKKERQKTPVKNSTMLLPEAPPARPVSVTAKSNLIPIPNQPSGLPIPEVMESPVLENIPNSRETRTDILIAKPTEPSIYATNKSRLLPVSEKKANYSHAKKFDLDAVRNSSNLTSSNHIKTTQKKQIKADNNWTKLEELLELDLRRTPLVRPKENATYPAIAQRNISSQLKQTRVPGNAVDMSPDMSNFYNQRVCEVYKTQDQAFDLETITAIIRSKNTTISQLLGQKINGGQIARNQNISDLLSKTVETRTQPTQLANLSIPQLLALQRIAAQKQLFQCQ